jgi:hypothetical protein
MPETTRLGCGELGEGGLAELRGQLVPQRIVLPEVAADHEPS